MNLYIDIDGVLLANDKQAALHVDEFVRALIESGQKLNWLTTWCRDDTSDAIAWLSRSNMKREAIDSLKEHLAVTNWTEWKTEAIDFEQPFLWFDDDLYPEEKVVLEKNHVLESFVHVDLAKNENQLQDLIAIVRRLGGVN